MTEEYVNQKAISLVNQVLEQVREVRNNLAKEMTAKGFSPDEYIIVDNFNEIVDNPVIAYKAEAKRVPRILRGENVDGII